MLPGRSSPTGIRDSDSELSEDDCSVGQELSDVSKSEYKTRRVARRKLLAACAVSLVFMTGEVIGETQVISCASLFLLFMNFVERTCRIYL